MMDWEDVRLQLIDTPPITADYLENYVQGMIWAADAALLTVDLSDDDGPFAAETVLERLAQTKTLLVGRQPAASEDPAIHYTKTLLAANKVDLPGAMERLEVVEELFGARFGIHAISAELGTGLEALRDSLYRFLDVIRVYSKQPGKPPDMKSPFTCPAGSTVVEHGGACSSGFRSRAEVGSNLGDGSFRRPNGETRPRPARQGRRRAAPVSA